LVHELLNLHYDPTYLRSMARNFKHFDGAARLQLDDGDPLTLEGAARALLQGVHADSGAPPA
jgi:hypothetical protein